MKRERKRTIIIMLIAMVAIIAALYFVMSYFEKFVPASEEEKAAIARNDEILFESGELKEEAKGDFTINKNKYEYYHDIKSYLFMGTDATGSDEEKYQGSMADFLLLLILDKSVDKYGFIQLDRDTMTEVTLIDETGKGEAVCQEQLCTAHWYGGNSQMSCENEVNAVSKLLGGIKIDGYYELNMDKISDLNDLVGGVEVTLKQDFSHLDKTMKKGKTLTLNGEQAYYFVHNRMDVGDGTNIERMERQKTYMSSLMKKSKIKMKESPSFVNTIYKKFKEDATTDLSGSEISTIANEIYKFDSVGTKQFEGKSQIGKNLPDGLEHAEFYPEKESIEEILVDMYNADKV